MAMNFTTPTNAYRDRELIHCINTSHMRYIQEDKTSNEIRCRRALEEHIKKFISREQHKNKFFFPKTAEVLRKNVKRDYFNALKAAEAWSTLSIYAKNLYNQPWRPEFHEIKLYSGFYKHQVESHLSDAESILGLMGYKRTEHKLILNEPIDKELLCRVSLDTIKAMCECQILFNVYEELTKRVTDCTYADILKYRESYPGSAERTIHEIMYYTPQNACLDCCSGPPIGGYPSHYRVNVRDYPYATNGYNMNYSDENPYQYSNGRCDYVRTAKLIDLDDDSGGLRSNKYYRKTNIDPTATSEYTARYPDHFLSNSCSSLFDDKYSRKRNLPKREESRDYVFNQFDKENFEIGPSNQVSPSRMKSDNLRSNGVSEAFSTLSLRSESDRVNNLGDTVVDGRERIPKKPNFIELNKTNVSSKKTGRSQTWDCTACTFRNPNCRDVCEICSKSRQAAQEEPLETGGKLCNGCTLVNKKEAFKCEVCDADLENSPTYV